MRLVRPRYPHSPMMVVGPTESDVDTMAASYGESEIGQSLTAKASTFGHSEAQPYILSSEQFSPPPEAAYELLLDDRSPEEVRRFKRGERRI